MKKIKIAFIYVTSPPFVRNDLGILERIFHVTPIKWTSFWDVKMILYLIKAVFKADVSFIWFADFHAAFTVLLSKIFRKKSIVIVGGYEVANVPEIRYGARVYSPISTYIIKFVLKNADKILAVSEFSKKEILKFLKYRNYKKVELVYNGVDCDKFNPKNEKEDIVITVGNATKNIYKLKGIDTFVKASLAFPKLKFVVIGDYDDDVCNSLKEIAPNVEFTGVLSHEEVLHWLKRAKVYCQVSYRESFGMALVESMICGCIPVVTNRGSLPEIVGDLGFIVDYGDVNGTIRAISNALNSLDKCKAVKERAKTFSIIEREKKIKKIVEEMTS